MVADAYEYFVNVWKGGQVDRPSGLWRRHDTEMEYLSLIDWSWHGAVADGVYPPHPDVLVAVGPEHVRTLLEDRQRFARYWVLRETSDDGKTETSVYRKLGSPEKLVEEVFGRGDEWIGTYDIRDLEIGGPHDVLDLKPIDPETAERLIQETRGVTGATEL